jgi:hypothetical protein
VGSVDRLTLVELIEAEKAKLSPEALELWNELGESHFFSNEADHFINEDFTIEEADTFQRHQSHQLDIMKRFERMPEDDQRSKNVLSELRLGLKRADDAESRGEPAQPYWDKCVIHAASMKDRDKWGPGRAQVEELLGRTVDQALARLRERSQLEAPQEAPEEASEAAEEQQGRGQPYSATVGAQEGARRPWWRRVFGS